LLLGSLLYQSRLVPRILPLIGFMGAALLVVSVAATLFDLWGQLSAGLGAAYSFDRCVGVLAGPI